MMEEPYNLVKKSIDSSMPTFSGWAPSNILTKLPYAAPDKFKEAASNEPI